MAPSGILVVQFGTNEEEATVFRAHAVPQGLDALMLLAKKQRSDSEHGYGP